MKRIAILTALLAALCLAQAAPAAAAPKLKVGVGRADVTPPTGYDSFGYVRADGRLEGALSRLWAKVIVLEQGGRKLALVSEDLGGIAGGMLEDAVARVADRGFSVRNVIDSATHTHSGPTGFFNFSTYNTVFMTLNSPTDFELTGELDPSLYAFMVDRLAVAIERADRDLGPGRLGWGRTKLTGPVVNRSLEAHLRDHGIERGIGEGSLADDPFGADHTLESSVDVLRVDRRAGGRWMPAGMWTNFANHGTVAKYQFRYYNRDHHGPAAELTEDTIRRRGHVPRGRDVVTVYGNGAEGDQSAGLHYDGPAGADEVGRLEGRKMLRAWRQAGHSMSRRIELGTRWTRMCFCGQMTEVGPVDDEAKFGLGQFTGSDEARGPLYDVTRVSFEGRTAPDTGGPQGPKVIVDLPVDVPEAVPLIVARIDDRVIGSIPGEATKQTGARVRKALIRASAGSGVQRALVSGLTNEFTSYYATAEEYDAQYYEGSTTLHGRASAAAVTEVLGRLAAALAERRPAPAPYDYDPTNGVADDGPAFPEGAASATPIAQPQPVARRLGAPTFRWQGGPRGFDRPLDTPFIEAQRRAGGRWKTVDSDSEGLRILWYVDDSGRYTARWEPALDAPTGTYRLLVTGNRYRLASGTFELRRSRALSVERVAAPAGRVAVALRYPRAVSHEGIDDAPPDEDADLTYRPDRARRGSVVFEVNGRRVRVSSGDGRFAVAASPGDRVEIAAGAARDSYGNRNGGPLVLTASG